MLPVCPELEAQKSTLSQFWKYKNVTLCQTWKLKNCITVYYFQVVVFLSRTICLVYAASALDQDYINVF